MPEIRRRVSAAPERCRNYASAELLLPNIPVIFDRSGEISPKNRDQFWLTSCTAHISMWNSALRGNPAGTAPLYELTGADELFATLDGRVIEVDGVKWRVEIVGIYSNANHYWIQVQVAGPAQQQHASTFRIAAGQADGLLNAVSSWLTSHRSSAINRFVTIA